MTTATIVSPRSGVGSVDPCDRCLVNGEPAGHVERWHVDRAGYERTTWTTPDGMIVLVARPIPGSDEDWLNVTISVPDVPPVFDWWRATGVAGGAVLFGISLGLWLCSQVPIDEMLAQLPRALSCLLPVLP